MVDTILNLDNARSFLLNDTVKGIPGGCVSFPVADIQQKKWNVLNSDMTLPLAILKRDVLEKNSRWMRDYTDLTGAKLCPHGKTTMAPQLFDLQLRDGAWGITASTSNHVAAYRQAGVSRILMANQLVGRQNIELIVRELKADRGFDFYCLVDSVDGLDLLLDVLHKAEMNRPLQLLLEIGMQGGRTGVRDPETAMAIARKIKAAEPLVSLRGIEAFEGIFDLVKEDSAVPVEQLLEKVTIIAQTCDSEGLFGKGDIILTAGGSAYFDRVSQVFSKTSLSKKVCVVLRSGCYLTHDSGFYTRALDRMGKRSPEISDVEGKLSHALEVCAYVQSIPEPGLAIANLGRRDASFDMGLPIPLWRYGASQNDGQPEPLADGYSVKALNDQHAYIVLPKKSDIRVGDMVGFGISHPCTTFDKWQVLYTVDENYTVIDAVKTYF